MKKNVKIHWSEKALPIAGIILLLISIKVTNFIGVPEKNFCYDTLEICRNFIVNKTLSYRFWSTFLIFITTFGLFYLIIRKFGFKEPEEREDR